MKWIAPYFPIRPATELETKTALCIPFKGKVWDACYNCEVELTPKIAKPFVFLEFAWGAGLLLNLCPACSKLALGQETVKEGKNLA